MAQSLRAPIPLADKEHRVRWRILSIVVTHKRGAQRRLLLFFSLLFLLLVIGLGWWAARARRVNYPAPFEQLGLELVAPSLRIAANVRRQLEPAPQYAVTPLTAVGMERLRQLEEDNRQLRAVLNVRDRLPTRAMVAEVIGRNNVPWEGNLLIGKGSADGVVPHMVAVVPDGVLGQVAEVSTHLAKIMLITDTVSGVPAMIARTRAPGVVKGDGAGKCRLLYLGGDADILPGDRVITSGLGLIFPCGLPIGTVTAIASNATLSSRIAAISPVVDPARVEFVVLVK